MHYAKIMQIMQVSKNYANYASPTLLMIAGSLKFLVEAARNIPGLGFVTLTVAQRPASELGGPRPGISS